MRIIKQTRFDKYAMPLLEETFDALKQTHFDKYTMPLSEETFDALKQANVLIPWTCNLVIISCH